ncbi:MAG: hypothetical protein INQ03_10445 [Candidatus Heimdallarchaeota archaeon]|nr:hypothetical protein [Candidatus Heimdallarchaeota archaeon]
MKQPLINSKNMLETYSTLLASETRILVIIMAKHSTNSCILIGINPPQKTHIVRCDRDVQEKQLYMIMPPDSM